MERYDQLYRLYDEYDAEEVRAYQEFVDLFPPVDSPVTLDYWEDAQTNLEDLKGEIESGYPATGEVYAEIAATATRDQAFTGLDLHTKYERPINALVLDVDETLRSAGRTDNEIPRSTLHVLTEFHDQGVPIVVCTGQTLENVKGFLIQGLGNEIVHSGSLSVVYESGTGVFTPGHGPDTKRLLYEDLDDEIRSTFETLRERVLADAPETVRRGCHLQGNEFNVTLKPNFETGSDEAREVIDEALVYLLDLLGAGVANYLGLDEVGSAADGGKTTERDRDVPAPADWIRAYYADEDPLVHEVLDTQGELPADPPEVPDAAGDVLERVEVAYYEADAAEVVSTELNKVVGVEAALDVLGVDDPFALVMGDSKSDLRVMRWAEGNGTGIAAAPEHADPPVLEFVRGTDELIFTQGDASDVLRAAWVLNRLADAE